MPEQTLWAPQAWIDGHWEAAVLLEIDAQGRWSAVTPGVTQPPLHARVLAGPVLPGLVDAHSHAFQRAFAGLSERRESEADDFWSWRERMYRVALRITPQQMRAIAAQLYVELLRGGYTQVCEFHYLHHQESGQPYADPATMGWAVLDAAQDAGIGLTLLPVLYQRAGFAQSTLRDDQRRFAGSPALVHALARTASSSARANINAGVAVHSLRAAGQGAIRELMALVGDADMPIHIHVAEQTAEVDDCLAATGKRPIEYLCQELAPDARWQLVHATHATASEIEAVARSGAGIVICPATEANLGDGLTDVAGWLNADVPMAIGSDSHVVRNWPEELRWLEYGQRLIRRKRNVTARPGHQSATAARLFDAALGAGGSAAFGCGGSRAPGPRIEPGASSGSGHSGASGPSGHASGHPLWGMVRGARADALVLDTSAPALLGIPATHLIDALVFAAGEPALREVLVAGKPVLRDGRHADQDAIARNFEAAMQSIWHSD